MIKQILKEDLRRLLSDRASELLIQRLINAIETAGPDRPAIREALKRIRVAVKLFVDEKLAEDLYAQLCRKARLD